jgi:hypothetical protein
MLTLKSLLCRLLIVLLAWTPFQAAQAEMIGTDQAASGMRARLVTQLHDLGVDTATAKDRVQALTDDEVRLVAQEIESLPAGGIGAPAKAVWLLVIIGLVIWWLSKRESPA